MDRLDFRIDGLTERDLGWLLPKKRWKFALPIALVIGGSPELWERAEPPATPAFVREISISIPILSAPDRRSARQALKTQPVVLADLVITRAAEQPAELGLREWSTAGTARIAGPADRRIVFLTDRATSLRMKDGSAIQSQRDFQIQAELHLENSLAVADFDYGDTQVGLNWTSPVDSPERIDRAGDDTDDDVDPSTDIELPSQLSDLWREGRRGGSGSDLLILLTSVQREHLRLPAVVDRATEAGASVFAVTFGAGAPEAADDAEATALRGEALAERSGGAFARGEDDVEIGILLEAVARACRTHLVVPVRLDLDRAPASGWYEASGRLEGPIRTSFRCAVFIENEG